MGLRLLTALAVAVLTAALACCGDGVDETVAPAPVRDPTKARNLAESRQPILELELDDGFWPVSVMAIDRFRRGERVSCLARGPGAPCRSATVGTLPWDAGPSSAYLDYPADHTDSREQYEQATGALGASAAGSDARLYFYVVGEGEQTPLTLQYWFYYPFNYLPVRALGKSIGRTGFHEGDFEGMTLLLSAKTRRPVYIWMSRHRDEGERFVWNQVGLEHRDGHPIGYVAQGSHATYGACGHKLRTIVWEVDLVAGLLPDDHVDCDESDRYVLGDTVPLINLARTGWACWRGHFGYSPHYGEPRSWHVADGPLSPLFQQSVDPDGPRPCGDAPAPARADRDVEIVGSAEAGRVLGVGGGRADHRFDSCGQWHQRPAEGSYMVACDEDALDAFFDSGLERPGSSGLEVVGDPPPTGPMIPAVYSSRGVDAVGGATIRTRRPARPEVYVAIRDGNKLRAAEFERFELNPGQRLRLRRGSSARWQLVDLSAGGAVVASAAVDVTLGPTAPVEPHDIEGRRAGDRIKLRFRAGTARTAWFAVFAGIDGDDLRRREQRVATLRGDPSGTYRATIADPMRRLRVLRILATRDSLPVLSRPVPVSEGPAG